MIEYILSNCAEYSGRDEPTFSCPVMMPAQQIDLLRQEATTGGLRAHVRWAAGISAHLADASSAITLSNAV